MSDVFLAVRKPVSLLTPTAKRLTGPVTPPLEANHQLDHFLCYQAKAQTKLASGAPLAKPPRGVQVEVEDQFQTRRHDLKAITKLRVPAAKSGAPLDLKGDAKGTPAPLAPADVRHAEALRVCYRATLARVEIPQRRCGAIDPANTGTPILPKQPPHAQRKGIYVADQLGALRLDSVREHELCVSSVLAPP